MRLVSVEDLQLRLDTKGLWVMYFMNCDLKIKCSRDASSCRQGAFYWHTKWRITSKNQQTLNSTSTATWLSRKCIYTSKICAVSFYFVLHESLRCKMKGGGGVVQTVVKCRCRAAGTWLHTNRETRRQIEVSVWDWTLQNKQAPQMEHYRSVSGWVQGLQRTETL